MNSDEIILRITNNAGVEVPFSIFGSPQTKNNTRVDNILAQWDFSAEPFTGANLTYTTASGVFQFPNSNPKSAKDVANLLNTTGVATFWANKQFLYAKDMLLELDRTGTINIF